MMGSSFHVSWYEQSTHGRHRGVGGKPQARDSPPRLCVDVVRVAIVFLTRGGVVGQLSTICFRPQGVVDAEALGTGLERGALSVITND